ncbi:DUF222 domain-containing protein [Specibacter sp. NPDC057265]|uniref:HNH endonuclease signature motif containing protein n=1 Tax=Specibacter sp. NPDC057265 TaxID=3346075 RepID=UPI003631C926
MGSSVNFPAGPEDSSTTVSVADRITALTLPVLSSLAVDVAGLAGLPDFPVPSASTEDRGSSRLGGVRGLLDDCAEALAALGVHRNRCAALLVVLVERLQAAARVEGAVLGLDAWQRQTQMMGIRAEVAGLLTITEAVAGKLMDHAGTLVHHLPATMKIFSEGGLGWEQAVVIAEETTVLRDTGHPQSVIDAFEQVLLGKAEGCAGPSFRDKARRARERTYPDSIAAKTRRAFKDRSLRVGRGQDGMSWLTLFGPSPTVAAIFSQCTTTAQAAQGPHESRTLAQLRADVAAALLLGQTMDENHIHTPPTPVPEPAEPTPAPAEAGPGAPAESAETATDTGTDTDTDTDLGAGFGGGVPVFEDPDYTDPGFVDPAPDPWDREFWNGFDGSKPPDLTPAPPAPGNNPHLPAANAGSGGGVWPPLPRVTPVLVVPALSLLGFTDEPAWMEGVGPISVELARRLTAGAPSLYRVLVDPITNKPLDYAPESYRISKAMKTMLTIRDEYCLFPGCTTVAVNCEVDHVKRFETGGRSVYNNLQTLCKRHHLLKHFKDDKTRHGWNRTDQSAERQNTRLRGWTPTMTEEGRVGWTSPTGHWYPPAPDDTSAPSYPEWLKNHIQQRLTTGQRQSRPRPL